MNVSVILPYPNPHVLDWLLKIPNLSLNIGCIKSTQDFRSGYFMEYDDLKGIKYFFKSDQAKTSFQNELSNSDVLITLGLFNKYTLTLKKHCKKNIKLIVLSEPFNPINSKGRFLQRRIWSKLLNFVYTQIDFFCIGGEDVKDYYYRLGFQNSKFYNFGYFPDLEFKSVHYKIEGDIVIIGFMGQFIFRKGFDRLILLIEKLSSLNLKYKILIAGDGEMKAELLEKMKKLKNPGIEYIGLLSNRGSVEDFLEKIDVLFVPSYFDGWGAVINEAIAKSCALVATKNVYAFRNLFSAELLDETDEDLILRVESYIKNISLLNTMKEESERKQKLISSSFIANEVGNVLTGRKGNIFVKEI